MSQYNAFNSNYYHEAPPAGDHSHLHPSPNSSKLFSSERLTHADLPSHNRESPQPPQVSATQLYFNLNNSLDGLLSKIEALK